MSSLDLKLIPRWCEKADILKGWVILHKDVTHPRGLTHLDYVKLTCVETGKAVFCRIFGPGSKPYNGDPSATVKESIYLDAHYQQRLNLDQMGSKQYSFQIQQVRWWRYYLNAFRYHPDDGVRAGTFLGLCSILLALASIFLGVLSLWPW